MRVSDVEAATAVAATATAFVYLFLCILNFSVHALHRSSPPPSEATTSRALACVFDREEIMRRLGAPGSYIRPEGNPAWVAFGVVAALTFTLLGWCVPVPLLTVRPSLCHISTHLFRRRPSPCSSPHSPSTTDPSLFVIPIAHSLHLLFLLLHLLFLLLPLTHMGRRPATGTTGRRCPPLDRRRC